MGGGAGTILWMAPELFGMRAKNTEKTDVYALGMVLYELLTHKLPFADFLDGKKPEAVVPGWLKDGERPEMPSYGDRNFKDLIERCWHQNSGSRPTADQVASRLEEMTKANPKPDVGRAHGLGIWTDVEGEPIQADLPTSTTGLLGSIVDYLASTSLFSQASAISDLEQEQVNKLLDHVMRGEQDEAEEIIKANPQLLNHKGSGKEFHNGREFKSITPFQYALWAMDWYMWDMMMSYMDHSEARMQLEELERRGTEHGKQFDGLDNLINAYQVYIDKYDGWNFDQKKDYLIKEVFPHHKAQPLCVWFALVSARSGGDRLATTSVRVQGKQIAELIARHPCQSDWHIIIEIGGVPMHEEFVSLKDTRNSQYKELRETLSKGPDLRIRLASTSLFSQASAITSSEASDVDQEQVNKLLNHVMRGEQDEAENMIKANPQLLNHKGSGKEFHNGREFKSITPFQYALWALDWYMWDMMMKHIDHSQARSQLEELESRGTEHGKQFDGFDRLINAYQVFIDKYEDWASRQRNEVQKHKEEQKKVDPYVFGFRPS